MYGDNRYLHVLTHSCPTRRSSDLGDGLLQRPRAVNVLRRNRISMGRPRSDACRAARPTFADTAHRSLTTRIDRATMPKHSFHSSLITPDRKSTRLNSSH